MVIKNKNGSEYRLKGPNPIMKNQNLWDNFEIHNMNFDETIDHFKKTTNKTVLLNLNKYEITIEDKSPKIKEAKQEIKQEVKEEIKQEVKEEIKQEFKEEIKQEFKEEIKQEVKNSQIKKTIIHCLPANVSIKEDSLYGDVKKIIKYGEKFTFDAVLLEITDFQISFWTNIKIENESIIYPKNSDKRWWKIINSEVKFDGNIFHAKISSITPNFED